jgi:radical SAM protein with 4Fe4S-binding SPASM domain
MLVAEKIPTMISFTAHQDNFREFPQVARLGRKLRVQKVWSDRLIPHGVGKNMIGEQMTPEQTQEFFAIMKQAREQAPDKWFSKTEIAMDRALQFMVGDGKPYRCYAGDSLITIQPNGDLLPCRRMPIPVGNVLQTPLETLYYQSDLFQDLRDENKISEGCEPCFYKKICRGGLKCLSLATEGDPFVKDPGCWR